MFGNEGGRLSHNKRKQMKIALAHLNQILDIHRLDAAALPGSVVKHVREAREILRKDKMMQNKWGSKEKIDGDYTGND